MKPIGPLMIEHRLIERMLAIMSNEVYKIKANKKFDSDVISRIIEFIRTYTENSHFGKEEDILFTGLTDKNMKHEHIVILNELIDEHNKSRGLTDTLIRSAKEYCNCKVRSIEQIGTSLQQITDLHRLHIGKEDKQFFYPCLDYLSNTEQDDMLRMMAEFDQELNQEKYSKIVQDLEANK